MSRSVPFDIDEKCDRCGAVGAWDFMGDMLCQTCLEKAELRKEIWDIGERPFLEECARLVPGASVTLIDGATLEPIGGYVPHEWNGERYYVLNAFEANKMKHQNPDEFAAYTARALSRG